MTECMIPILVSPLEKKSDPFISCGSLPARSLQDPLDKLASTKRKNKNGENWEEEDE